LAGKRELSEQGQTRNAHHDVVGEKSDSTLWTLAGDFERKRLVSSTIQIRVLTWLFGLRINFGFFLDMGTVV
ncbi:MAG: hypothetical protein WB952_26105, partial [Terriglobales bacterium]